MTPKPYSEKSSLPIDSSDDAISGIPIEVLPQTPSPGTITTATTPSPTPQEVPVETFVETVVVQENNSLPDLIAATPCYPTPGDIMPYDHSLPDFIRQITNQPNLANLQKLSLRVISTLISLHKMSTYLPNLRELDLEGSVLNSLRDIGCSLKNLQILKVGRCQLESLDGTFGLSSLRELYAQKNFINDVSPCSNLPHIRHVDVSGNRIHNISYAGFLSVCNKLKSIVFIGNPAAEAPDYRKHVRRILPQIETLDGIPFNNEDETEEVKQSEQRNNCKESDINLEETFDLSTVGPSNNHLLEWGKNKEIKILADQFHPDDVGCESLNGSPKMNKNFQFHEDSNDPKDEVTKAFVEREETTSNRNPNAKQKCTNILKLDKDMVNHSKKTNSLKNGNYGEELASSSESSHNSGGNDLPVGIPVRDEDSVNLRLVEEELAETSTGAHTLISIKSNKASGTLTKKSFIAVPESKNKDEEKIFGLHKLTTGLPVCGNLTAALRNRKKIKNGFIETQTFVPQKTTSQGTSDADEYKKKIEGISEFGYNVDIDYVTLTDLTEDDSSTCKKWRESFLFSRLKGENKEREDEKENDFL